METSKHSPGMVMPLRNIALPKQAITSCAWIERMSAANRRFLICMWRSNNRSVLHRVAGVHLLCLRMALSAIALLTCLWSGPSLLGVDAGSVAPWRQDQPPNEPYSPNEAVGRMKVPSGFTVELVASE